MKGHYTLLFLSIVSALSACGGGGGGNDNNNSPSNTLINPPSTTIVDSQSSSYTLSLYQYFNNSIFSVGSIIRNIYKQLSDKDYEQAKSGYGVYIALVDTGININQTVKNKDDISIIYKNLANISSKSISQSGQIVETNDYHGHGTQMTKIILDFASEAGISAAIVNNNQENSNNGVVYTEEAFVNMLLALKAGAKIDIINNSYAEKISESIKDEAQLYDANLDNQYAILKNSTMLPYYQTLVQKGALIIKATGNDDREFPDVLSALPLISPELEKGFLIVSAYDQIYGEKTQNACGELTKNWCITAPEKFLLPVLNSTSEFVAGGTSNATAYISALAARIKSRYDWFSAEDIKNALLTTAEDKGEQGVDAIWGHGLVNEENSLKGYGRFDYNVIFQVDGNKKIYFFDNDISGNGGMTKTGQDILVMNGNNTYQGDTIITQGELIVNANSLYSHHRINPNGILTIGDNVKSQTIRLANITNEGKLYVYANNLEINGNLDNRNGTILQAVGPYITVSGTANLMNSQFVLIGLKNGYSTKVGEERTLLYAGTILYDQDSFSFQVANNSLGELINHSYRLTDTELSVVFSRKDIGTVVRNSDQFTGRDSEIDNLEGLFSNIDQAVFRQYHNRIYDYSNAAKKYSDKLLKILANESSTTSISNNIVTTDNDTDTIVTNNAVAQALLQSQNVNQTLFEINTMTAVHTQELLATLKARQADNLIQRTLQISENTGMWIDTGFGRASSKQLADVKGKMRNNTQTVGFATPLANGEHIFSIQASRLSNQWSENYRSINKNINIKGIGIESSYVINPNNYWVAILAGYDHLKATTTYSKDSGHQYMLGIGVGKSLHLGTMTFMPNMSIKYTQLSGLNYILAQYNYGSVSVEKAKTMLTTGNVGLDFTMSLDSQQKWLLTGSMNVNQILTGKTNYVANYDNYLVNMRKTISNKRPEIAMKIGLSYQMTTSLRFYTNAQYNDGKYYTTHNINTGLQYIF